MIALTNYYVLNNEAEMVDDDDSTSLWAFISSQRVRKIPESLTYVITWLAKWKEEVKVRDWHSTELRRLNMRTFNFV